MLKICNYRFDCDLCCHLDPRSEKASQTSWLNLNRRLDVTSGDIGVHSSAESGLFVKTKEYI